MADEPAGPGTSSTPWYARPLRGDLSARLFRAAAGSLGLQASAIGLSFVTSLVLANLLGAGGFGAYSYAITWANILAIPATLGLGHVVARETARAQARQAWGELRGLVIWTGRVTWSTGVGVAAGAGTVLWVAREHIGPEAGAACFVALPILVLTARTMVYRSLLVGLQRVVAAQSVESVLRPLVFLALVLGLSSAVIPGAREAVGLHLVSSVAGVGIIAWIARRHLPGAVASAAPETRGREWLGAALPMLVVTFATQVNADAGVLVLGAFGDPASIGLYKVASRLAGLPVYLLTATNTSLSPVIARLHAQGRTAEIEAVTTRSARITTLVAATVVAALLWQGELLLGLFGPEFVAGYPVMAVLALGQLANVASGSVGLVLLMTGHERDASVVLVTSLALNVLLNVLLVGQYGLMGSAVATGAAVVLWNTLLGWVVWRRLGIVVSALSWRRPR